MHGFLLTFGGQLINLARNDNVVAAFTLDDLAWTEVQQRTFIAAIVETQRMKPGAVRVDTGRRDRAARLENRSNQTLAVKNPAVAGGVQ